MLNKLILYISVLHLLTFISGCVKKSVHTSSCKCSSSALECFGTSKIINRFKDKHFVAAAKQNCISIPVGYKLKSYSESGDISSKSSLYIYNGNQNTSKVEGFYKKELEIDGWTYSNLSTKKEGLFVANKSSRNCVISIRPTKSHASDIYIHMLSLNRHPMPQVEDNISSVDLNHVNGTA